MSWMVTGGAGYIGSHVVRALIDAGIAPVVLDDLSSGIEGFVPDDVPFVRASILDTAAVTAALVEHGVVGLIHCAGYKYAGESVKLPVHTYRQNVEGTGCLLDAMAAAGVTSLVFSSSAGAYGTPPTEIVTEETPTSPESPYGETKLIGEWLIRDQMRATAMAGAPLTATNLRYFNVVGSGYADIYDASPHNLFPKVFTAIQAGRAPQINGTDYPTPDGTCIRDYVHVSDLAAAHVVAAQRLDAGEPVEFVYNLGSGAGTSVKEIVDAIIAATGCEQEAVIGPRRAGDPAIIVATGELAARDLGWANRHTVTQMVESAWAAHPRG
ncbi:UDP-glucose 4-epimerase GalE [Demequina sp. SYSU T00039]|uniref:UDP-glucose 4-epimerase n=1 Tax=Demequina lignilytica TaxID=3051663 RepID=A0AAW7M654_9MICO|nr:MULTISPECIES: UDP-glucose 4-epimerase GalE [unclassified Demequina]MDN4478694.1 UDP-glucose 4-epimerase GalE [Demequina sp. SYSU T00039-1]MDN4488672.1 UDP-glucose 4-epimerase GalE [Demequina sp. SYSU T00039]